MNDEEQQPEPIETLHALLGSPEAEAALQDLLQRLIVLHQHGAIDTLFETVLLLHSMRSALTDQIVDRGAKLTEELLTLADDDGLREILRMLPRALREAQDGAAAKSGGLFT
ncbi:MAG: hypothetical protein AAF384_19555, partial [Pseudomonadota bacterium]